MNKWSNHTVTIDGRAVEVRARSNAFAEILEINGDPETMESAMPVVQEQIENAACEHDWKRLGSPNDDNQFYRCRHCGEEYP